MNSEQKTIRKLRAILSADVKGYSLLMADDDAYTVNKVKQFQEIMSKLVDLHSGRVVDAVGDNLLAEFSSVVDAVKCSVEIQKALKKENEPLPENKRLEFRIGINIGDVIQDSDRIYGSGVNVAARIEGLAEPGGVCISRNAFDQVKEKLNFGYEYFGRHTVKNIKDPVSVYKVLINPEDAGKLIGVETKPLVGKWIWPTIVIAAIILTLVGYKIYQVISEPEIEPASVERLAYPLPDKPSIAVLPFVNMSADPHQEYFSDGLTEDLITDLSKISGIFVIGRNSTFTYKGKAIKIRQIAEELGVRYVIEGSVRKVHNRVRINAQLIDATAGHHLWAERYDGKLDDIFDLQDRINKKIVNALAVQLTTGEREKLASKETESSTVYDIFLQGLEYYRQNTPKDWAAAVSYLKSAVKLDPNYGRAYALLAQIYDQASIEFLFGLVSSTQWCLALEVSYDEADELANQYMQLAKQNPTALYHWIASRRNLENHWHEAAIVEAEKALAIDPNNPDILIQMARALVFADRPTEAITFAERALRIDPNYGDPDYYYVSGMAYFTMKKLEEALPFFEKAHNQNPEERWFAFPLQLHMRIWAIRNRHGTQLPSPQGVIIVLPPLRP